MSIPTPAAVKAMHDKKMHEIAEKKSDQTSRDNSGASDRGHRKAKQLKTESSDKMQRPTTKSVTSISGHDLYAYEFSFATSVVCECGFAPADEEDFLAHKERVSRPRKPFVPSEHLTQKLNRPELIELRKSLTKENGR